MYCHCWRDFIMTWKVICKYMSTHPHTHEQCICCLRVMVLFFCAIFAITVTHRTYWQSTLQSTQQNIGSEQTFPLAFTEFPVSLIGKFLRSHYFVNFSSRQPLPVAWQLAYMCQHIQNTHINSGFFTLTYLALTHFYPNSLQCICVLPGNWTHDLDNGSEWGTS